jgi:hypothetical protein
VRSYENRYRPFAALFGADFTPHVRHSQKLSEERSVKADRSFFVCDTVSMKKSSQNLTIPSQSGIIKEAKTAKLRKTKTKSS